MEESKYGVRFLQETRLTAQKGEPMAEKKLSEELRFCIEQDGCSKCSCFETQSKLTCPGLLQKAYEAVKRYEEMFPCEM